MYKKEYGLVFEIKDEDWKKKHDFKNLKDFSYQEDKTEKGEDKTEKEEDKTEKEEDKKEKEDKTEKELPSWIKSRDEFNELKGRLLGLRKNKLKTNTDKHQYDFSYMKKLIKDLANNKTTKHDAINDLKEDSDYIEDIKKLKKYSNRSTIISTYTDFVKLFSPNFFEKTDNKTNNKTGDNANNKADNEEMDTTNIPDLET